MIRALVLWALMALPGMAADLPDPGEVVDRALELGQKDDMDGAYEVLAEGLQAARNAGDLPPEWGIVFALMTDMVRNFRENPAYALMLAEEGLAVVAPNAGEAQDIIGILNISRSYALADLGRLDEAVRIGRLAEPQMRANLGDEIADEYLDEIASWEAGATTQDGGVSPMALAERSRREALFAIEDGDYARALTLSAQAVLPAGTGLPLEEVRLNNADAMRLTGRALWGMGRKDQSLDALLLGAAYALGSDWSEREEPVWQVRVEGAEAELTDLMIWLSRSLMEMGEPGTLFMTLARRTADIADSLTPRGPTTFTTAYIRSTLAMSEGGAAGALAELRAMAGRARAEGLEDYALLSEFYVQTQSAAAAATIEHIDTVALIAAAEAALAYARDNPASVIAPGFVAEETAAFLAMTGETDRTLDFARRAFRERMDWLAASGVGGLGDDAYRRNTRQLAQTLLQAASRKDGTSPGAICPDTPGTGCVIIVETGPNSPG